MTTNPNDPTATPDTEETAMNTIHPEMSAVLTRIERMGLPTTDYNIISILGVIYSDEMQVDEVSESDFLKLLMRNTIEDQTDAPCPEWCGYEHGHRFEMENHEGTSQSRFHSLVLVNSIAELPGVDAYVSITAEEHRVKPVDATARLDAPHVTCTVDGELTVEQARLLGTALLDAAYKLDEITR